MRRELTREELELLLTEIWLNYKGGYMPKNFPLEYGDEKTYQALNSVVDDIWEWVDERFGKCEKTYGQLLNERRENGLHES